MAIPRQIRRSQHTEPSPKCSVCAAALSSLPLPLCAPSVTTRWAKSASPCLTRQTNSLKHAAQRERLSASKALAQIPSICFRRARDIARYHPVPCSHISVHEHII